MPKLTIETLVTRDFTIQHEKLDAARQTQRRNGSKYFLTASYWTRAR